METGEKETNPEDHQRAAAMSSESGSEQQHNKQERQKKESEEKNKILKSLEKRVLLFVDFLIRDLKYNNFNLL